MHVPLAVVFSDDILSTSSLERIFHLMVTMSDSERSPRTE